MNIAKLLLLSLGLWGPAFCAISLNELDESSRLTKKDKDEITFLTNIAKSGIETKDSLVMSSSRDGKIKIWDLLNSRKNLCTLSTKDSRCICLADLGDGFIVSGHLNGEISVWNVSEKKAVKTIKTHDSMITVIADLGHEVVAVGYFDGSVKVVNLFTQECYFLVRAHENPVISLIDIGDYEFASASLDGKIKIWDPSPPMKRLKITLSGHTGTVNCLINISPSIIASSSDDGTIKIWNTKTGKCLQTLSGHSGPVLGMTKLLREGNFIASGSSDGTIKIWNLDKPDNAVVYEFKLDSGPVKYLVNLGEDIVAAGFSNSIVKLLKAI